ncbi:DUF4214 domain-containing protein [Noviherbaspirillum galbum]|uniref:DUF4214 domain-containing protein n=1 Tax=Noviherbaspirillum galbum TaxID=2709383 RepID=A0A6B3SMZ9_9BURK|nr:DUF4214 domain-containing protein [Noviherbaspirillum galbum]NEX62101.1 DUF4214 domain-containing protein [Noviherbaspirillum galbum]
MIAQHCHGTMAGCRGENRAVGPECVASLRLFPLSSRGKPRCVNQYSNMAFQQVTIDTVQKLYVTFFSRPADVAGLAFWADKVEQKTLTEAQIAACFVGSVEYQSMYGHLEVGTVISSLYAHLFGRTPATNELLFWANRIFQGLEFMDSLALKLANSAQGTDANNFANKVSAAELFTGSLQTARLVGDYAMSGRFNGMGWLSEIVDTTSYSKNTSDTTLISAFSGFSYRPFEADITADGTYALTRMHVVNVKANVAAGSSISFGSADDSMMSQGGSVAPSSSSLKTLIDGGAGTNTLSAALVNAANAEQFANFQVLSLDSQTGCDVSLLSKCTIKDLVMKTATSSATYDGVTKEMAFSISYFGDNNGAVTTLRMTSASGPSDDFTITFKPQIPYPSFSGGVINAGTIAAEGIEHFYISTYPNIIEPKASEVITLGADSTAQTVTIERNYIDISLSFADGFGSRTAAAGGVSLIDASQYLAKITIDLNHVTSSAAGLKVLGGSDSDTIITGPFSATLTGGGGTDNFIVNASVVSNVASPVITTITDISSKERIIFHAGSASETFIPAKVDVSNATSLYSGVVNALDLAASADGSNTANIRWFQYQGDTYLMEDMSGSTALTNADLVVKLTGLYDLSNATYSASSHALTIA